MLIEDNEDDRFALRRALKRAGIAVPLNIAEDGKQAMEYLRGDGPYADRDAYPLPALIFLDLKLPYIMGFEILRFLREESEIRDVNVIVLSGSDEPRDRCGAERLGVSGYIVKPAEPEQLIELFQPLGLGPVG